MKKTDSNPSIKKPVESIIKHTLDALAQNPTILLLFIAIAILDFTALFSLFLAHSMPFSIVFAPIIRTFWDDRYLHYPENFLLLPKIFNHAHVVISLLFGVIVTGIVIKKLEASTQGKKIGTLSAAAPVLKKYLALVAAWVIGYFVFTFAVKGILQLTPKTLFPQLLASYVSSLVIQSLLMFIFPALVLGERGFIKDFISGIVFGVRYLIPTSILIALPVLVLVVYSFLKSLTPIFVQTVPESVLWILGGSVLVSMIVDLILTSTTTLFYLKVRNQK